MATSDVARQAPTTRPALKVLQADQRALLSPNVGGPDREPAFRPGFESRRQFIEWYQRAVVRTFGELADVWAPRDLARDETLLVNCIVDDARRERFSDDPPPLETAEEYRLALETNVILPAANRAYRELRKVAGEYGDDGAAELHEVGEPSEQAYVAMRPGFAQKDVEQRRALRQLWGGFPDRRALADWLHELNEPTYGAVEADLPGRVMNDPVAVAHLVGTEVDARAARAYREWFAIGKLLPAFVDGIRDMDSVELASRTKDENPWNEVRS